MPVRVRLRDELGLGGRRNVVYSDDVTRTCEQVWLRKRAEREWEDRADSRRVLDRWKGLRGGP